MSYIRVHVDSTVPDGIRRRLEELGVQSIEDKDQADVVVRVFLGQLSTEEVNERLPDLSPYYESPVGSMEERAGYIAGAINIANHYY